MRFENCCKCDSHHTLYYEKEDENGKKKSFWHCMDCESEWTTDVEDDEQQNQEKEETLTVLVAEIVPPEDHIRHGQQVMKMAS